MRKPYAKITVKMVNEWVDLYKNQHKNTYEIGEMYNCSPMSVTRYLKMFGIKVERGKYKRKKQFYKNQFLICLYDLDEQLVGVFDNVHELSKYCGKSVNVCRCCLTPKRLHKKMRINGKWYRKELIEVI